ncbi:sensor histidine kinase [Dactylosporangium siamense]|uniref:Histidine kinase/HSP90-like ATPase domain-containing protein n=1 Tax=Dactylosporangium siamense TaxID=685454 RepID=A0A919Q0X8_9ACTN|nr:sensor histidine kinase [Dactylosporangium siamense]GIG51890.1 hypothetical protein Dsi01nite_099310 [Dactylosporangium siamense]
MSERPRGPAVLAGAVVAWVAAVWGMWFAGGLTFADSSDAYLLNNSVMALAFTAFGALVLTYHPGHRIGRLFVAYGLCYAASLAALGLLSGWLTLTPGWQKAIDVFGIMIWTPAPMICLPLILQMFPDGTPLSPRWRALVPVTVALGLLFPVLMVLAPDALANEPIADRRPLAGPAVTELAGTLLPVDVLAIGAGALLSVVVLGLRVWRSRGKQRLQLLWLLWAIGVFLVLNLQRVVTADGPIIFVLSLALIPAAATVAIVRHGLYDIRVIVNRSLVYGLLTAGVAGAYLGIVAALGAVADEHDLAGPIVATGAVALAFAPARSRVQTAVDRVMYGGRADPAAAAARVGSRLTGGLDGVLRAVCESLRLPYAAVSADGQLVATYGELPEMRHSVPLDLGDGPPADLLVGLRAGERRLAAADRRALELLAAPIGLAVREVRLSGELRESRTRIVAAREEERRRLRRDLHDGLGTALTAVTLKADAAHNALRADPDRAGELLLGVRRDVTGAIADIRRLVYDLRPPDLDELGLLAALRQRAEQSWVREVTVTVDAPDTLPALPAAVEVAAYRIATEAVTNTMRHGGAATGRIRLRVDGGSLHVEVSDDGTGDGEPWRHGVGLRSMHERAAELGGTLTAGPTDAGGRVHATLPLENS